MVPTRWTCISVVTKTAGIRHTGLLEGCFSIAIERGWVVQILDRFEPVLLRDWKPDGLLVFEPCPWAMDWARQNSRPLISVCMDGDDGVRLDLDDHEVGKAAARFLLERGYFFSLHIRTPRHSKYDYTSMYILQFMLFVPAILAKLYFIRLIVKGKMKKWGAMEVETPTDTVIEEKLVQLETAGAQ